MIGADLGVSIVSLAMIGYCCNCLGGQLNYQAFTHWLMDVLLTINCVISNLWHSTPASPTTPTSF